MAEVVDLFAGPGGWDLGALAVGLDPLGIELDDAACETREAAGLRTVKADVAELDPADYPCDLLIASPPCQAWSMAGKRQGETDKPLVYKAANRVAEGEAFDDLAGECEDARSMLVVQPLRWAMTLRPRLLAFEQVPPVLGLWRYFGELLREADYSVWVGNLESERYGVPQTRKRAILMAAQNDLVHPPAPTHARYVKGRPPEVEDGVLPWVSMAQALGWAAEVNTGRDWKPGGDRASAQRFDSDEQPAPTIDGKGRWQIGFPRASDRDSDEGEYRDRDFRGEDEPAFTVTEKARSAVKLKANAAERSSDEPAPTIKGGHDSGDRVWTPEDTKLDQRRRNPADRTAADPAPTLEAAALAKGRDRFLTDGKPERPVAMDPRAAMGEGMIERHGEREPVDVDAPAPAITTKARSAKWVNGTGANAAERSSDEPAPTVHFGERLNTVGWVTDTGNTRGEGEPRTDGRVRSADEPAVPITTRADQLERRGEKPISQRPAPTITTTRKSDQGMLIGRQLDEGEGRNVGGHGWTEERPSTTVQGDPRVAQPGHKKDAANPDSPGRMEGAVRVSLEEAAILQGFPLGYPWQGSRTKQFEQVGNAVPPPLAAAVLDALLAADPELAPEANAAVPAGA